MTQSPLEFGAQPDLAPTEQVMVALDLETTGLNNKSDRIIEVGAVKFRGGEVINTISMLVNPHKKLNRFIIGLTGITQEDVDGAPSWDSVVSDVASFIGNYPMVGHRVSFDAGFLKTHNAPVSGPLYDTYELASVLLPGGPDYSLGGMSSRFGFTHENPHRALSDALATRDLFLMFLEQMNDVDAAVLRQFVRLGTGGDWTVGRIASQLLDSAAPNKKRTLLAPPGIDRNELNARLRVETAQSTTIVNASAVDAISNVFAPEGILSENLPAYEHREQQVRMASAVSDAINDGSHLVIEAGTGVGKSLAYLVPAALRALSGGGTVVVSTNTINLQDQLMTKDVPAVEDVLEAMGIPKGTLRVAQLKGRANYICFKRWLHAQASETNDFDNARVLGKTLNWLQTTETGDRGELSLPRYESAIFSRMSAQGAMGCPSPDGPCFLRKARYAAQTAHIVVVNHAMLMSDVAMGGGLIPDHSALIIDEAHHLEAVATRHLGFSVNQLQFESEVTGLQGERGVLSDTVRIITAKSTSGSDSNSVIDDINGVQADVGKARTAIGEFYDLLGIVTNNLTGGSGYETRITSGTRAQPAWENLEIAWENMELATGNVETGLRKVLDRVGRALPKENEEAEAAHLNLQAAVDSISEIRIGLRKAIVEPEQDQIYWLNSQQNDTVITVNAAPLRVGPILEEELFARERSVVLTSGTLSTGEGFERLKAAVGLNSGVEIDLGSPFDYKAAALVAIPQDLPEPNQQGYPAAVHQAIRDIALATRDRMLVLFTSNSALQTAREALKDDLGAEGIQVIGQGPDGTPYRIMNQLRANKETVALGASSLWEGVDLDGTSIKTIVIARLPFPVPSEPVFEARSEQYDDSFNEYAVPEAVMRFRQGFGRLIRKTSDRGALVILDSRVANKRYGERFISALPDCRIERGTVAGLGERVKKWLAW